MQVLAEVLAFEEGLVSKLTAGVWASGSSAPGCTKEASSWIDSPSKQESLCFFAASRFSAFS